MSRHKRKRSVDPEQAIQEILRRDEMLGFNVHRRMKLRTLQLQLKATYHERRFQKRLTFLGIQFIFQHAIGKRGIVYVADFFIPKSNRLVIEIDGASHFTEEGKKKDAIRDAHFIKRGCRMVHITNQDVISMTDRQILDIVSTIPPHTEAPLRHAPHGGQRET